MLAFAKISISLTMLDPLTGTHSHALPCITHPTCPPCGARGKRSAGLIRQVIIRAAGNGSAFDIQRARQHRTGLV